MAPSSKVFALEPKEQARCSCREFNVVSDYGSKRRGDVQRLRDEDVANLDKSARNAVVRWSHAQLRRSPPHMHNARCARFPSKKTSCAHHLLRNGHIDRAFSCRGGGVVRCARRRLSRSDWLDSLDIPSEPHADAARGYPPCWLRRSLCELRRRRRPRRLDRRHVTSGRLLVQALARRTLRLNGLRIRGRRQLRPSRRLRQVRNSRVMRCARPERYAGGCRSVRMHAS